MVAESTGGVRRSRRGPRACAPADASHATLFAVEVAEGDEDIDLAVGGDPAGAGQRTRVTPLVPPEIARPEVVLTAMIAIYVFVFGRLVYVNHRAFGTFGFDLGIFDQGIWLVSRLRDPFVTVRGLDFFANHVNVTSLLFVPFYWLGAGAAFLCVFQAIAIAAAGVPLWLIARDRLENEWLALAVPAAYLLYPSAEWITWWQFHPDALAITPFLFAVWFAMHRRWRWFALCVALTLGAKEDVSFAVFMLGLFVAWRYDRRVGLVTSAAAAAWLIVATRVVIPLANGGAAPFYEGLYGDWGNSIPEIVRNVVTHPRELWQTATDGARLTYYRQLLAPVAFVPLAAPFVLLVAAPNVLVNILSVQPYTYQIKYQYSAIVGAVIFVAMIEGCRRIGTKMAVRRFLVGLCIATSLATNVAWSPSPLGVKFHSGIWARESARTAVVRTAVGLLPRDAGVSATYYVVPHITHRAHVYEFPNPFHAANWGINDQDPPDPGVADYLLLDRQVLGATDTALLDSLTRPGGPFRVTFDTQGVVVARRVRPGT
jgi:uncharacterized membrane protein